MQWYRRLPGSTFASCCPLLDDHFNHAAQPAACGHRRGRACTAGLVWRLSPFNAWRRVVRCLGLSTKTGQGLMDRAAATVQWPQPAPSRRQSPSQQSRRRSRSRGKGKGGGRGGHRGGGGGSQAQKGKGRGPGKGASRQARYAARAASSGETPASPAGAHTRRGADGRAGVNAVVMGN